ncbi:MAG: thiol-disulfide oxidoreductase DCC family protein [Luteolibacter sp.]
MGWVLFFDGKCGFCSGAVRRVYELDEKGVIDFAPLQGELAGELGLEGYAEKGGGSMVLMDEEGGELFVKGDAVIRLGKMLGGFWAVAAAFFWVFPKGVRDRGYDLVARNRHLLPGDKPLCELPDEELVLRMRS